jgi:predicted GNAT family acetyltransferase
VLLAIENDNLEDMFTLLKANLPLLPTKFYSHLSAGLEKILEKDYNLDHHGEHYKMHLAHPENLEKINTDDVETLGMENLKENKILYQASYPGNWFDPRMLETGQYVGIREKENLVCVAGIHVYSPDYKIAALGNITTQPELRGQGLGTTVTAGLCKQLLKTVDVIGLNVKSDNMPAIRAYEKIGFEVAAVYSEWMVNLAGS